MKKNSITVYDIFNYIMHGFLGALLDASIIMLCAAILDDGDSALYAFIILGVGLIGLAINAIASAIYAYIDTFHSKRTEK